MTDHCQREFVIGKCRECGIAGMFQNVDGAFCAKHWSEKWAASDASFREMCSKAGKWLLSNSRYEAAPVETRVYDALVRSGLTESDLPPGLDSVFALGVTIPNLRVSRELERLEKKVGALTRYLYERGAAR